MTLPFCLARTFVLILLVLAPTAWGQSRCGNFYSQSGDDFFGPGDSIPSTEKLVAELKQISQAFDVDFRFDNDITYQIARVEGVPAGYVGIRITDQGLKIEEAVGDPIVVQRLVKNVADRNPAADLIADLTPAEVATGFYQGLGFQPRGRPVADGKVPYFYLRPRGAGAKPAPKAGRGPSRFSFVDEVSYDALMETVWGGETQPLKLKVAPFDELEIPALMALAAKSGVEEGLRTKKYFSDLSKSRRTVRLARTADGELLGYAVYERVGNHTISVEQVVVHPQFAKFGIANTLVDRFLNEYGDRNITFSVPTNQPVLEAILRNSGFNTGALKGTDEKPVRIMYRTVDE